MFFPDRTHQTRYSRSGIPWIGVVVGLLLLLPTVAGLNGCGGATDLTAEEYIARAKDYEDKGEHRAAVIELKNALRQAPNSVEARWLLGSIYLDIGDANAAEKELRRAADLGMDQAALAIPLTRAALMQGRFKDVIDDPIAPQQLEETKQATLWALRGHAQLGLGNLDSAEELYDAALSINENEPEAGLGKAQLAVARGELEEARAWLDTVRQAHPNFIPAWILLGNIERYEGNTRIEQGQIKQAAEAFAKAVSAYSEALNRDPKNLTALESRALVYVFTDELEEAKKDLDKINALAPRYTGTHFVRAVLNYAEGNTEKALDSLRQLLSSQPDFMPGLLLSAAVLYDRKSYEQAVPLLTRYVSRAPGHLPPVKLLASTYLKLNQPDQTQNLLKPYIQSGKADPQMLALAGEAYLRGNDLSSAEDLFENAAELVPASAALRTMLGLTRLAKGEEAEGLADLEASSALDTKNLKADVALVGYYLAHRQFDKALSAANILQTKLPEGPLPHALKGLAYAGKGDFAKARDNFERALALNPTYMPAVVNLAELDLSEGNSAAARARFENVLAQDKNNVAAMLGLAHFAFRENNEKEYVDWLEKAASADEKAFQPRFLLAEYYINKKDPQTALRIAREAYTANPANVKALALLARAQQLAGDNLNAVASYEKLVQIAPTSAMAHYQLAKAHLLVGDENATRKALLKALEIQPDYGDALAALSALELRTGKPEEGLRLARELQTQYPKSSLGFSLEGDALMVAKRYSEAASAYEKALGIKEDGTLAAKLHKARVQSGEAEKADGMLVTWLNAHPEDVAARTHLAQSLIQRGLSRQAIEQLEILLNVEQDNAMMLNNLAVLYQEENDSRALTTAEKAYALQPDNPLVTDTLGWILVQQDQIERGLPLLEKAVAAAPQRPEIRYHLAYALARSGQTARARREIEQLQDMKLSPELERQVRLLLERLS